MGIETYLYNTTIFWCFGALSIVFYIGILSYIFSSSIITSQNTMKCQLWFETKLTQPWSKRIKTNVLQTGANVALDPGAREEA